MALIIRISLCSCQDCVVWIHAQRQNLPVDQRGKKNSEHVSKTKNVKKNKKLGLGVITSACVFRSWWRKTTPDGGGGDNGTVPDAFQCEWYLVRVRFTARPEGKVNSDEKNRNNNKRAGRQKKKRKKAGIRDALRAKTADKNLTAEWRPDCSNSLSSQVFFSCVEGESRDRKCGRKNPYPASLIPTHTRPSPPFKFTALKLFALCF